MTAAAASSFAEEQGHNQASVGLSPGVIAALQRVQYSLREALPELAAPFSLECLAAALARQGLLVTLRAGLGVGVDCPDYLSTLRHSFLVCQDGSGVCVVVDPSFREQFIVAGMPTTSSYVNAVANVPECFIGTIGTVNALVCLLTGTLQQESSALGLELPPWRSAKALISKWLPRRFTDRVFTPPSSNLHPLLRSTVHGAHAATASPTSIQSWTSLHSGDSRPTTVCSRASSDACCAKPAPSRPCSGVCAAAPFPFPSEPHTVVKGFTSSAGSCGRQPPRAGCGAAGAGQPPRSALTQQLAAASKASRTIQEQAQEHWQRCFEACGHGPAACGGGDAAACYGASCGSGGSCSSLVHSLVLSPVHRRHCAPAAGRRDPCASVKLSSMTLKQLPRIYTVKLATVAAC